ncbi:MAG TPA: hypothetical protein VGO21_01550 [Candidatus Paceibacterota bacterium]|nr:hypothetical protein [Candidatus Paceibacterota bacterium]
MTKVKLLLNIILLLALTGNAQYKANYDTLRKICDGPVFTMCEVMPYLTNGSVAYADTLTKYLSTRDKMIAPGKVSIILTIIRTGEIKFIDVENSTITDTHDLTSAIEDISNQWTPGTQNKHLVCCYRRIYIEVTEDSLKVTVPER